MKVTILGCGPAGGVPSISAGWGRCDPANSRNARRRSSILVEEGGCAILVDTGPDLRAQLLDAKVRRLDAVIYTHSHADHLHGIDELREINRAMGSPLDIYGDMETIQAIRDRFPYVFEPLDLAGHLSIYKPWLIPHPITSTFGIGPFGIEPFVQDHGVGATTGFRFGAFAYSTDLMGLPESSLERLEGLDLWVVGCFGSKQHPTHAHVDLALGWIERLQPKRAVITHMGTSLDYAELEASLPPGVSPAHDGQVIEV